MQKRTLSSQLQHLAFSNHKIVLLSGPRQVGKTTLAKALLRDRKTGVYANWDEKNFRKAWAMSPKSWVEEILSQIPASQHPLIVLDELHKARLWKRDLKGLYDHFRMDLDFIVTGSARLDIFKKGGDSLLGRFFAFTLHPFSYAELLANSEVPPDKFRTLLSRPPKSPGKPRLIDNLLHFGGFPEPFLNKDKNFYNLWQKNRHEKIVREDLRDLSKLPELGHVETLMALLPERAAQQLSVQSLREDLEVSHATVKRWLDYLTQLYYCYLIRPYSRGIIRSLKKEPKLYLWDWAELEEPGAKFENFIAGHLMKTATSWSQQGYGSYALCYLRNKEKEEVDFLLTENGKPYLAVEVKLTDRSLSPALIKFAECLKLPYVVQVIREPGHFHTQTLNGTKFVVMSSEYFLIHCA